VQRWLYIRDVLIPHARRSDDPFAALLDLYRAEGDDGVAAEALGEDYERAGDLRSALERSKAHRGVGQASQHFHASRPGTRVAVDTRQEAVAPKECDLRMRCTPMDVISSDASG
jgi:hypothetical protein